ILRDRSRSTARSVGHEGSASSGASNSFWIQAEYKFSVARFHDARTGQTAPGVAAGGGAGASRTAMARVMVPQPDAASAACQVPTAGDATSANQKYGGPPWRSRDLATTRPSGPIRESSPSSGFSAANTTRSGAPFHGAIGVDSTVTSAAPSSQLPDGFWARESVAENSRTKNAPAIGSNAVIAAASRRVANTLNPSWNALKLHPIPAARGRPGGYRIGEDQSAGMKAILRPAGRL